MTELGSPDTVAAFDVDAQNCFTPLCPAELPVPDGNMIVDELNAQAALAGCRVGSKDAHSPSAVWVADAGQPQLTPVQGYENADTHWNLHAVPGTRGFELLDGLPSVTEYDFFVWKGIEPDMHPYGSCYHDLANRRSTGVIEFLRVRGIETVLVGGLALDFCVKTTVFQLCEAGFRVIVNLGACRSLSSETGRQAVEDMKRSGAEFIDSASCLFADEATLPVAQEH